MSNKDQLKKVKKGDRISAAQWNLMQSLLARESALSLSTSGGNYAASRRPGSYPAPEWFKASEAWTYSEDDNGCFVMCNPCDDRDGTNIDTIDVKVFLPRQGLEQDPNVEYGDIILAVYEPFPTDDSERQWVAVNPNLDGRVYRSIRMWHGTTAPAGWHLCDGTEVRAADPPVLAANAPDLRGRFVVGYHSANGLAAVTNLGAAGDYDNIGWRWGTAWHGVTEFDDWDGESSAAQNNNHPDHQDHVHSQASTPCYAQALICMGVSGGVWTGIQKKYVSGETPYGAVFRHAGPFNDWPSGDTDEEVHDNADTDNRPPFYTLAFIIRTDNSEEEDIVIPTELEVE